MEVRKALSLLFQGQEELDSEKPGFVQAAIAAWLLWDRKEIDTVSDEDDIGVPINAPGHEAAQQAHDTEMDRWWEFLQHPDTKRHRFMLDTPKGLSDPPECPPVLHDWFTLEYRHTPEVTVVLIRDDNPISAGPVEYIIGR